MTISTGTKESNIQDGEDVDVLRSPDLYKINIYRVTCVVSLTKTVPCRGRSFIAQKKKCSFGTYFSFKLDSLF